MVSNPRNPIPGNSGTPGNNDYLPHQTRRHRVTTRPIPLSRPRIPETHDGPPPPDLVRRIAAERIETAPLVSRQEVEDLKRNWLANPVYDIEFAVGFELVANELAAWHDDQIMLRARMMGCSHLMASILEELVRCWIHGVPPKSSLACRVLESYR